MTGLLVSVRDADEARDAVEAGADLIDIKEPQAGPLGAAAPETIAEIVRVVAGRRPTSVALGELAADAANRHSFDADCLPRNVQFAKLGLAGCVRQAFQSDEAAERFSASHTRVAGLRQTDWRTHWLRAIEQFPTGTSSVAVVYADFAIAHAPPPDEIIDYGHQIGCRAMLIDTFDKRGPGLLGILSIAEIKRLVIAARDAQMFVVLGGQITKDHLPDLQPLEPDYIAVRGAVCRGDRSGRLDPVRLRQFLHCMQEFSNPKRPQVIS
jgi:(5-formylfuran-3-yl)methyl phosphate synthase